MPPMIPSILTRHRLRGPPRLVPRGDEGFDRPLDILLVGDERADTDPHGRGIVPARAAAPALPRCLYVLQRGLRELRRPAGYQHLVEHDLVEDGEPLSGKQLPEELRHVAQALHKGRRTGLPQGEQGGPQVHAPGAARHIRRVQHGVALLPEDEVGARGAHRRGQRLPVPDKDDPVVVRRVQRLVRVRGPGVGLRRARGEVLQPRRGRRPQPKGPVNVDPGSCFTGRRDNRFERVEGSGVHVPCLQDQERARIQARHPGGIDPALRIHRHALHPVAPEPQQAEGLGDARVRLLADHYPDLRRSEEAARAAVPAGSAQELVPAGRQAAERGHRGPAHETRSRSLGEAKEVRQPSLAGCLQGGSHRGHHLHGGVLVPRVRQPPRGHGRREAAAVHEAEIPAAGRRRRGRRPRAVQHLQHPGGIGGLHGQL